MSSILCDETFQILMSSCYPSPTPGPHQPWNWKVLPSQWERWGSPHCNIVLRSPHCLGKLKLKTKPSPHSCLCWLMVARIEMVITITILIFNFLASCLTSRDLILRPGFIMHAFQIDFQPEIDTIKCWPSIKANTRSHKSNFNLISGIIVCGTIPRPGPLLMGVSQHLGQSSAGQSLSRQLSSQTRGRVERPAHLGILVSWVGGSTTTIMS